MASSWIQQRAALSVPYKLPMGDSPRNSQSHTRGIAATAHDKQTVNSVSVIQNPPVTNATVHSQRSGRHQPQARSEIYHPTQLNTQYRLPGISTSPMNMVTMAAALPEDKIIGESVLNTNMPPISCALSGVSPSTVAHQFGLNMQMHSHVAGSVSGHSGCGVAYTAGPYQQNFILPSQVPPHPNYPPFGGNPPRSGGPGPMQNPYHTCHPSSQYLYYSAPYGPQNQFNPSFASQSALMQSMYGRTVSFANNTEGRDGSLLLNYAYNDSAFPELSMGPVNFQGGRVSVTQSYNTSHVQISGIPRAGTVSIIPRGPPRKPKQSGHALWVGNLPPGTTVMSLKDHFSRDATKDIESLFLISKSNCAFVNYRTEDSCKAAMQRFHDSRFNGVRLVCRLRRSLAPTSGVPTGPSAMLSGQQQTTSSRPAAPSQDSMTPGMDYSTPSSPCHENHDHLRASSDTTNKYFVVKSLTLQDLELSAKNGIWATQSHNEEALNRAYETAQNVYLIFSANKSGEYFGFARMASPIIDHDSQSAESVSKSESSPVALDVPRSIPTPATEWAPKGKIIDDSARGTIFWEAEVSETDQEMETAGNTEMPQTEGNHLPVTQSWGKLFKIEWISTHRLPFYRTRGLRNPWNANREVKIARDGTELEPSVGERLLQMFHRMSGTPGIPLVSAPSLNRTRPV